MDSKLEPFENDLFVMDVLLKLKALENILVAKGIFTAKEYLEEQENIAKNIANEVLQKSNITEDFSTLLESAKAKKTSIKN